MCARVSHTHGRLFAAGLKMAMYLTISTAICKSFDYYVFTFKNKDYGDNFSQAISARPKTAPNQKIIYLQ